MDAKGSIFFPILSGKPIITSEKLIGNENYLSRPILLNYDSFANAMRIISLNKKQIFPRPIVPNGGRYIVFCVVFYGNPLMPKPCIILRPIRLAKKALDLGYKFIH